MMRTGKMVQKNSVGAQLKKHSRSGVLKNGIMVLVLLGILGYFGVDLRGGWQWQRIDFGSGFGSEGLQRTFVSLGAKLEAHHDEHTQGFEPLGDLVDAGGRLRTFPHLHDTDGFFAAGLRRRR